MKIQYKLDFRLAMAQITAEGKTFLVNVDDAVRLLEIEDTDVRVATLDMPNLVYYKLYARRVLGGTESRPVKGKRKDLTEIKKKQQEALRFD